MFPNQIEASNFKNILLKKIQQISSFHNWYFSLFTDKEA